MKRTFIYLIEEQQMSKISKQVLDNIFHAYDVRGTVPEELNTDFFYQLGKAFVTFLNARNIVVGHDIRKESELFQKNFIKGAIECGCNVTDIGEIGTEMIYFATGSNTQFDGGAVITASHNPSGWNGCKMVGKNARAISKESGLDQIKSIIQKQSFKKSNKKGSHIFLDIYPSFKLKVRSVISNIILPKIKIVIDAGNGIGGKLWDYIFDDLNLEIIKMYFEPDGDFPNHTPDPLKEENVKEIKQRVVKENADLGIAIDGDADRVFFIDNKGRNPSGIYTGSVFCKYLLKNNPGQKIIHDPRITWPAQKTIEKYGGIPLINRAGHSFFKERMREEDALLGIEMSCHFFYRDFYYADSGMFTIAYMLKFLASGLDLSKEMDHFYTNHPNSGEVNFTVEDIQSTINRIKEKYSDGKLDTTDGIGISYNDWRFNLRPSNTQPLLRLNVEGTSKEIVIQKFKEIESVINGKRDNQASLPELNN